MKNENLIHQFIRWFLELLTAILKKLRENGKIYTLFNYGINQTYGTTCLDVRQDLRAL